MDYYNWKRYHSILIQALVDFQGQFLDVNISWCGKVHDTRVVVSCSFYMKTSSGTLVPHWLQNIGGISVPILVVGDAAYPLLSWLVKPYIETPNSTPLEHPFNYQLSRESIVMENAFGQSNGLWRYLLKMIDLHVRIVPDIVTACVKLHDM